MMMMTIMIVMTTCKVLVCEKALLCVAIPDESMLVVIASNASLHKLLPSVNFGCFDIGFYVYDVVNALKLFQLALCHMGMR